MSRRVTVIGGGASGLAAAYAAAKAGARVTLIIGGPGATSLYSGALDGDPKSAAESRMFAGALGIWEIPDGACQVATSAGLLRSAEGRDVAVMDLGKIQPGTIGVVDVRRRGWDARGVADAWTQEAWAIEHGLRFEAVTVEALRHADEDVLPIADLALRHDDPERVRWLAGQLRASTQLADKKAVVMGPWLGLEPGVASELTLVLGKPVGEPLSGPGGASGLRFERARDALVAKMGVERVGEWATQVAFDDQVARVELASGSTITADAVIMSTGGLVGGGVEWSPASTTAGFTTSLGQPGSLALHGRPLNPSGSPEGALFERFSWSGGSTSTGIERVGIWSDAEGHVRLACGTHVPWLYAAGDAVADAPRNVLEAIRSGLVAGDRAARGALISSV